MVLSILVSVPFGVLAQTSPEPTCTITANKTLYNYGETITLSWSSQNATYAAFQQDMSGKDALALPGDKLVANGSQTISASVTGNPVVTLLIYGGTGNSNSCSVMIPIATSVPTCTLTTNKKAYKLGETITFYWTSQNATYGSWQQSVSSKDNLKLPSDKLPAGGSQTVTADVLGNPHATLLIYGYGGSNSCTATVSVGTTSATTNSSNFNTSPQITGPDIDTETISACLRLNNNLRYRSRDIFTNGEVSSLQDFLQTKGYLKHEPTGFFGLLTLSAVKNFQGNSLGSGYDTGFVGPLTRAKIKDITCQ